MDTSPPHSTASTNGTDAFVALDVIAQLREETADAMEALDAPEADLRVVLDRSR